MLNRLDLEHFKCFERLKLPLAPLTLLSGSNASGKSSVLQALVLLQQTMHEHEWSTRLMLNGATIRMGTVSDVVDKVHGRRTFTFGMMYGERNYHWTFTGERPEMSLAINRVEVGGVAHEKPKALRYLLPLNGDETTTALANYLRCLTYITAERVGPREGYSLEDRQIATVVGPQGEHAVSVLHWGRDEHVLEKLAIPGVAMTLQRQVEARMHAIPWIFRRCATDPAGKRRDTRAAYLRRHRFPSPDSLRIWAQPEFAHRNRGAFRNRRGYPSHRESRGSSSPRRASAHGTVPGGCGGRWDPGHRGDPQRPRSQRRPPVGQGGADRCGTGCHPFF